jgi:CheY-like chemotaxis protein
MFLIGGGMRNRLIFVVDDDRLILNLLEYTISSHEGYNVTVFQSSEDCINSLEQKPDVIILDHQFESDERQLMTGLEALVEIRKREKSVPVIILSNQNNEQIIEEYYRNGATSYIPKKDYFISTVIDACEKVL